MKAFAVWFAIFACAVFVDAHTYDEEILSAFEDFKVKYSRVYATDEEHASRLQIFANNYAFIQEVNSENLSYTLGINQFADMSNEEFAQRYTSFKPDSDLFNSTKSRFRTENEEFTSDECSGDYMEDIDWPESLNFFVRDQGKTCNSAYAMAFVGTIEARVQVLNRKVMHLSEQEIVDCSKDYGNHGCTNGFARNTYSYIKKEGLAAYADYQYVGMEQICQTYKSAIIPLFKNTQMQGLSMVTGNVLRMTLELQCAPLIVSVDSSNPRFRFYKAGILDLPCTDNKNHHMILVGYMKVGEAGHWKLLNSWGEYWGEKGYARVTRENPNLPYKCLFVDDGYVPHII